MAEQVTDFTHHHKADDTQSRALALTPNECNQADNHLSLTQTAEKLDSSSTSTNSEDKNNSSKNVKQAGNNEDDHTCKMKPSETITHDDQGDGPNLEDRNTEAGGGKEDQKQFVETMVENDSIDNTEKAGDNNDGQECGLLPEGMDLPENPTSPQTVLPMENGKKNLDEQRNNVETTHNTSEATAGPTAQEDDHPCKMKPSETITHDDQGDGPNLEDRNTEAGGGKEDQKQFVETIGSTSQEATEPTEDNGIFAGKKVYLMVVIILVAILVPYLAQPKTPPQTDEVQQIDIFLRQLEKVKTQFPNQRAELWNRTRIHLKRHLQTAQPTEPVSLILTAGIRAERTLHCLAQGLASAFSFALNASVLHIDGASKASQDSDVVKLDIDRKLQGAFEGDKPVAVIHRFEELPPGSTLIFYRYCDHENAAFKETFLIFTVLLGEKEAIPAKIRLSDVEEMVDDHLKKKFLSHGRPVSFDRMDLDKYGGLWSRISHLILPVASEERVERDGCEET